MALLEVESLQTHFRTPDGVNRAVDGVSFQVAEGETRHLGDERGPAARRAYGGGLGGERGAGGHAATVVSGAQ